MKHITIMILMILWTKFCLKLELFLKFTFKNRAFTFFSGHNLMDGNLKFNYIALLQIIYGDKTN